MKNGGRQRQNCNLDPFALFTGVDNFLLAELSQLSALDINANRNVTPLLL